VTTKNVLFHRTIESYDTGVYLVCSIKGRIFYKITPRVAYQNQLVLGVFLDPAPSAPAPAISPNGGTFSGKTLVAMTGMSGAEVRYTMDGSEPVENSALYSGPFTLAATATIKARTFKAGLAPSATTTAAFQNSLITIFGPLAADAGTQGGWRGVYGNEGFLLPSAGSVNPSYSELALQNASTWVWQDSTSDARGQIKPASTDHMAACWYHGDALLFDIAVYDTAVHSLSMYFLDWDKHDRRQTVEAFDMSGNLLDRAELSNFSGGVYLRYKIKGQVRFKITKLTGDNAVLNGIFFDEGPIEAPPKPPAQSFAIGADRIPVFTFSAPTGSTICIDVSTNLKTWEHTGNRVVTDGKVQLKESDHSEPTRFYHSHIVQ
jgi:hypothetical protein